MRKLCIYMCNAYVYEHLCAYAFICACMCVHVFVCVYKPTSRNILNVAYPCINSFVGMVVQRNLHDD